MHHLEGDSSIRKWLLSLFKRVSRPFWGKGIYRTLPFVGKVYFSVYRKLNPSDIVATEIQGLKIYAETMSGLGVNLGVRGTYEEETTKLFLVQVREGMTVLDIGANIGYYSLLAGRQVGEKGKVFAFEPWHANFSLLQRNIEANGFKNIIPVAKAVLNRCGRQRLFLAADPSEHSLCEGNDKESVEIDVTTVDEFVREQNISVDLIKMDVEGSEMRVLEGMTETINKNPDLKIITEFSIRNLERDGCFPEAFLRKLVSLGFELYAFYEKKHTWELITRDVTKAYSKAVGANIYCERHTKSGIAGRQGW